MRDKAKDTKPRTGTQKPEFKFSISRIADTFRNETFLFVSGAILTILAIFFIIAYISFLFTGGTDQSAVLSGVQEIENSTGKLGASMSEKIVNGWFGFSSLLIPVFLIVCGLNMMRITHFRVFRWFVACTFLMVWLSVFFQFILSPIMQSSFIVPGGSHGMNILNNMHDYIGVPGVILSLLLTMLLFCIYLTRRTIQVIRDGADSLKRGMRRHEQPDTPAQDQADEPLEQQPQYDDEPIFEPAPVTEPEPDETIADDEEQEAEKASKKEGVRIKAMNRKKEIHDELESRKTSET
jgi:S-DNA-T family DNA segregation ATPase FtsK/SpoIIIE